MSKTKQNPMLTLFKNVVKNSLKCGVIDVNLHEIRKFILTVYSKVELIYIFQNPAASWIKPAASAINWAFWDP